MSPPTPFNRIRSSAALLLCVLAALRGAVAQDAAKRPTPAQETQVLLDGLTKEDLPGVGCAIGVQGEIVFAGGSGFADLEHRVPVGPATRFRIASISKPVTTAILASLIDRNEIDLDATVRSYLPDLPEDKAAITIRHLAGHLSGIRHYRGEEMLSARFYDTVKGPLGVFIKDPLLSPPGEAYHYSTYGYTLLSAALETAAKKPFLELLADRVTKPLQLTETGPDLASQVIEHRARPYRKAKDGIFRNAPAVDNSNKWAGGGLLSSMRDLVRFGDSHLHGGHFSANSLDLLFTPLTKKDGTSSGYGLGWSLSTDPKLGRIAAHSGGAIGGSSYLLLLRDHRVVVALAANSERAALAPALARSLATLWLPPR